MFLGEYSHTLDDKGRVTIPAKFREYFADGCVVTRGYESYLVIYTAHAFQQIAKKAQALSPTVPENRMLFRMLFAGAGESELDKAGRINIPAYLREYAGLDGEVVLVGTGQYVEVWSRRGWEQQLAAVNDAVANAARFTGLDLAVGAALGTQERTGGA